MAVTQRHNAESSTEDSNQPWDYIDALLGRVQRVLAYIGGFSIFVVLCFAVGYLSA